MTNDITLKQRGKPFAPANSGRPHGSRNKVSSVINAAKDGDMLAAKLVPERILPPLKTRRLSFPTPPIETVADCHAALNGPWAAVSTGQITVDEAGTLAKVIGMHAEVLNVSALEERIKLLEAERRTI
jgi:hypothetical protein